MPTQLPITLFHSPRSQSSAALTLLEELHAPYSIHALNMKAWEQRGSAGPRLLGNRFTAADVLWGSALTWMTGCGLVEGAGQCMNRRNIHHPANTPRHFGY